jgi:hypothetical protein
LLTGKKQASDSLISFSPARASLSTLPNFNNAFIDPFFPDSTAVYAGIDLFNRLVIDKNLLTAEIAAGRLSAILSIITVSGATRSPI